MEELQLEHTCGQWRLFMIMWGQFEGSATPRWK